MPPEEMVGLILDHYRIIEAIGRGGMATVFLAQDIYLQRNVAVKIFRHKTEEGDVFWRRFAREARVVAQLDHPNILMVHEYGEHAGFAYFIMPYLELGSLRDRLRQRQILPWHETVDIIIQILQALQYAHERGLIHRDIKPDNILFKTETNPVLSDFGLAKVVSDGGRNMPLSGEVTGSVTTVAGTPQYMAPEQIQGKPTPASDIYSIGVVLYEMLTGVPPFKADSAIRVLSMHLHERPRPLRELNTAIPPALEAVVLRALEKDQSVRYPEPKDFSQALAQVVSTTQSSASWLPLTTMPAVPKSDNDRTEIRQKPEAGPLTTRGPQEVYNGYGAQQDAYKTIASQSMVSTPIVLPVRDKRGRSPRLLLAGLLISIVLFASFGAWYSLPYLQAKGIFSLVPSAALKTTTLAHSSSTGLAIPQTSCPAHGTARAAILPPLLDGQGMHQNVVYVSNRGDQTQPTSSLVRYDAENGQQTVITSLPDFDISEAQISDDGQWILFTSSSVKMEKDAIGYKIQMVRIDGKELQTLYCADPSVFITKISLSPFSYNASSRIIFNQGGSSVPGGLYQLNLNNGSLQRELQGQQSYDVLGWPSPDSVYLRDSLTQSDVAQNKRNVYLLNLTTDNNQTSTGTLHLVTSASSGCDDFSFNFGLYSSSCVGAGFCESDSSCPATSGPSTISIWVRDDKTQQYQKDHTSYANNDMAVVQIRAVSNDVLLALVANSDRSKGKNGVWKITLSTGQGQLLVPDTFSGASVTLNAVPQQAWSNVSRDGQKYAVRVASPQSLGYDSLYMGNMDGNGMLKFASSVDNSQLFIVGWTTS